MTGARYGSFSAADLERAAVEARAALRGARIVSVAPGGREALLIEARGDRSAHLFVSLVPGRSRAHLVSDAQRLAGEETDPMTSSFCERASSALEGASIEDLDVVEGDRVMRLLVRHGPRAGASTETRVWLVLFGPRPDALVTDAAGRTVRFSLRAGGRVPEPRAGTGETRPPLFPEIAAAPATRAYSRALEVHFAALHAASALDERRRALAAEIARRRRKALAARARLEAAIAAGAGADDAQRAGEILLASFHLLKRGAARISVPDFFAGPEGPPREIELDPARPPSEQAAIWFKRARKRRRGAEVARARLAEVAAELERLLAAESALSGDGAEMELAAGRAGIRSRRSTPWRGPERSGGPRRFRSRDGFELLVGRTNAENDELTLRTARGRDLFFHVLGFAGAHVIVRVPAEKKPSPGGSRRGRAAPVPLDTLLDAAALAVHYSKARDFAKAEVSYTPRKYVRKPRGAKPGLVTLDRSETLYVPRDDARLARILATAEPRDGHDE